MENRKSTFGKSASMPLLQQDLQQSPQQENQPVYADQYQSLQQSPGFQEFRASPNAQMWSPPANGFLSPGSQWRGTSNRQAGNDTSSFMGNLHGQGPRPTSLDSDATVMHHQVGHRSQIVSMVTFNTASSAYTPTVQAPAQLTADINAPRPLPRRYTADELVALHSHTFSDAARSELVKSGLAKPVTSGHAQYQHMRIGPPRSTSDGSANTSGSKTPTKSWLPGLGHPSLAAEKSTTRKGTYVPGAFAHNRRASSRVSSLPAVPSPLGPRHYVDDLGSDISGLVSPLPVSSPATKRRDQKKDDNEDDDEDSDGFEFFGLDIPVRLTSDPDSEWFDPSISVYKHARKITDPFVEHANNFDDSPTPSPSMSKVPRMPMPTARSHTNARQSCFGQPSGEWIPREQFARTPGPAPGQGYTPMSPYVETPSPRKADHRFTESTTPKTSSFETFTQASNRVNLPIPPPPLSSVQGRLSHDPTTRARLDAQAETRAAWIRTEAKEIADLSRLSFAAAQKYQQTGLQKDFEHWQKFAHAYEDATNLEKRQEERRNTVRSQVRDCNVKYILTVLYSSCRRV